MAKLASIALLLTIVCLLASTQDVYATKHGRVAGKQKVVKLVYYVHVDISLNVTTFEVAKASITDTSPTSFGSVRITDHLVTADPDPNSPELGRSQGLVPRSDLSVPASTLNLNIYFTAGKYAGSTLSILGRYEFDNGEQELVVAGGTGSFRFAHGYAIQTTESVGSVYLILRTDVYITYNDKCIPSHGVRISKN